MSITRCAHCIGGTVLGGSCIACGREVNPRALSREDILTYQVWHLDPTDDPALTAALSRQDGGQR